MGLPFRRGWGRCRSPGDGGNRTGRRKDTCELTRQHNQTVKKYSTVLRCTELDEGGAVIIPGKAGRQFLLEVRMTLVAHFLESKRAATYLSWFYVIRVRECSGKIPVRGSSRALEDFVVLTLGIEHEVRGLDSVNCSCFAVQTDLPPATFTKCIRILSRYTICFSQT